MWVVRRFDGRAVARSRIRMGAHPVKRNPDVKRTTRAIYFFARLGAPRSDVAQLRSVRARVRTSLILVEQISTRVAEVQLHARIQRELCSALDRVWQSPDVVRASTRRSLSRIARTASISLSVARVLHRAFLLNAHAVTMKRSPYNAQDHRGTRPAKGRCRKIEFRSGW